MRRSSLPLLIAMVLAGFPATSHAQSYDIRAVRYATIPGFRTSGLVRGADSTERIDIAMVFWLIEGEGRTVLFDTGFHRASWFDRFTVTDFVPPDSAARLAGVAPNEVTDVIVSHAHWDHMGGIDLFPEATVWIQADEFAYYTGPAWQNGGRGGGSDPDDLAELVRRNTAGKVQLIDGDDVEILPGIRVYTGARHTYASQYVSIAGDPLMVLASDNAYLYRNLTEHRPVATFTPADSTNNLEAITRMLRIAGSVANVVPGHDPEQFVRFPTSGRVARIR